MRLFFASFLAAGLLLIGYSVHERRQAVARGDHRGLVITNEDGTGYPVPDPSPTPKNTR